jgi:hypothetical protein
VSFFEEYMKNENDRVPYKEISSIPSRELHEFCSDCKKEFNIGKPTKNFFVIHFISRGAKLIKR